MVIPQIVGYLAMKNAWCSLVKGLCCRRWSDFQHAMFYMRCFLVFIPGDVYGIDVYHCTQGAGNQDQIFLFVDLQVYFQDAHLPLATLTVALRFKTGRAWRPCV